MTKLIYMDFSHSTLEQLPEEWLDIVALFVIRTGDPGTSLACLDGGILTGLAR